MYESLLALCTDEGIHFAELKVSDLSIVHKPHMVLFPEKMFRTGVLVKPWLLFVADFYSPGYLLVDCKTRQVVHTL